MNRLILIDMLIKNGILECEEITDDKKCEKLIIATLEMFDNRIEKKP